MGCGASSLKGDDVPDLNANPTTAPGQGIKKVKTNFSTVDYDQDAARQRRMTEYAPHETIKPREPSLDPIPDRVDNDTANKVTAAGYPHEGSGSIAVDADFEPTLKPYQTFSDGDWDQNEGKAQTQAPHVNGTSRADEDPDPTSPAAKNDFANTNDPANPLNQRPRLSPNQETSAEISDSSSKDRKKSWLGGKYSSYQSAKKGSGTSGISDEDLKKYTGKDRSELSQWAKTAEGVGGDQSAGRVGMDSRHATGAAWVA